MLCRTPFSQAWKLGRENGVRHALQGLTWPSMLISSFKGKGVLLCENISPSLPVGAIYYSLAFYDNLALYNSLALYYDLALYYNLALYDNPALYSSLSKPQSSHQTSVISSNLSNLIKPQ